jgi:GTP-binding protein
MSLPVVAIVGRPNVGKSSLFNLIARRRLSIVDPTAGVTRDRVTTVCDIDDVYFELVDTGGYGIVDRDDLDKHVERQIQFAVNQADLILFLVDAREGINPLDHATAELLRRSKRADHVRLLANKVDEPHMEVGLGEFVRLGFGDALAVSAANGNGKTELRDYIRKTAAQISEEVPPDPLMKIALVGKRNAGKSSFVNALAGEERVIVSEIPGTTRDSVDVRFEKDGRTIVAIDTAGVRKRRKIADDVEYYTTTRVSSSIHRSDVVLFLIDSTVPVSQVDKKLASLVASEYKPCVLVVNKWDLAKGRASTADYAGYLEKMLPEVRYAPIVFTSAIVGKNTSAAVDLSATMFKQARTRVSTGYLNSVLKQATETTTPGAKKGRKAAKFYYATQVGTQPPTIVLFVNGAGLVKQDYERYLLNRFRETLPFGEIPIRLVLKPRRDKMFVA